MRSNGYRLAHTRFTSIGGLIAKHITPRINALSIAARRVFPFGLGGQPLAVVAAILRGIIP